VEAMMKRSAPLFILLTLSLPAILVAQESPAALSSKMSTQELAQWIDQRFEAEYQRVGIKSVGPVSDATYLRRIFLDLQGRIPTVAQVRDFLADESPNKRNYYVDQLLTNDSQPERYARRASEHLARVWRRMMVPANSLNPDIAVGLEPWLARQFANNEPYDHFARKIVLASPRQLTAVPATGTPAESPDPDAPASLFQAAVGASPENLTSAFVRVFLGVRLNCAQCHDHPLAEWKQDDFWGVAALLTPNNGNSDSSRTAPTILSTEGKVSYKAKLLWSTAPLTEIPANKSPRELLADWMISPENPNFAPTAVNRVWQYLCGRGLAGSVDNLDQVSPIERQVLDDLAQLFIASGYDVRWLISGICKSRVYQQIVVGELDEGTDDQQFTQRPLKALLPEQVFDSLEQALCLPVAKVDNGPRFNGDRDRFVARMNESAPEAPSDFKGGVPQALMLMNGKLTADATNLETSRTLRAVVDAPFLGNEEKIEALYFAALTRKPRPEEMTFLLNHVTAKSTAVDQKQAFAEILWGILNSPEFVLNP